MNFYFLVILAYFLGSIPFGYLIAKVKGVDVKKEGSGSTGATNVSRVLGLRYAILVGVLDILKAGIPVFLAIKCLSLDYQIVIVALAPVLGHIFTPWLSFKGGKGIATTAPSLLAFLGGVPFLCLLFLWMVMLKLTKTMSLNNLILMFFVPFLLWYFKGGVEYFVLGVLFFLISLFAHRENVYRMYNKKELKL